MRPIARLWLWAVPAVIGALGLRPAQAMMLLPTNWPVERLLANLERYVEQHPTAAEAHYCIGRIHTYAFVLESAHVAVRSWGELDEWEKKLADGKVTLDELAGLLVQSGSQPKRDKAFPKLDSAAMLGHLRRSVLALQRALELAPDKAAFHLTLAYAFERGAHLAAQLDSVELFARESGARDDPLDRVRLGTRLRELGEPERAEAAVAAFEEPEYLRWTLAGLDRERCSSNELLQRNVAHLLRRAWLDRAIEHYRIAFERSCAADLELKVIDDYAGPVALEAGEAWLRLTEAEPERFPAPAGFRARVLTAVEELGKKPLMGWTTPIALSLEGCHTLDELIAREHTVLFDVDGDLVEEAWPWLRPEAGWLVWDPKHTGAITSGRQLFGSASGWFFFPDGYRVLDALDDDGNGELRDAELLGISVWFDRDSDGVSDRGEVVPVEALGIVALATEATERIGRSLGNPCGVELADGRVLPTYDWVLSPSEP